MSYESPNPEMRAKLSAALDQLAAAISESAGEKVGPPFVILARTEHNDGLAVFHYGLPTSALPAAIEAAAEVIRRRPPDHEAEA